MWARGLYIRMVLIWILGFALLGSVGAIAAAATFLLFPKATRESAVPFLISYATGTLLGASAAGIVTAGCRARRRIGDFRIGTRWAYYGLRSGATFYLAALPPCRAL